MVFTLNEKQQRDVLEKSIKVITDISGKKPRGWTAPSWSTSKEIVHLLEEYGIIYDHSFMHHDSQMYHLPYSNQSWIETDVSKDAEHWMKPMGALKASSIVEVPANWHLDDWPPFQLNLKQGSTHGFVDPYVIERMWKDQFEYYYREYDNFVFPISIHPQVSGKAHIALMHERLIEWINTHEGVEWCTMEEMVKEFKEGRMTGATVEGGADL